MMRIGIIGGALQGMEAVFLSKKAGFETLVIDRKEDAPAISLADSYEVFDISEGGSRTLEALQDCDVVLPAFEEMDALIALDRMMKGSEIPFLFDMDSYRISSSKERSNEIMRELDVPLPIPWPECGYPAIVKPSSQSGSVGVSAVNNEMELEKAISEVKDLNDVPIIQEFVSGKSVSIEVIGDGKDSRSYFTTEVILNDNYDCKMVLCEPNVIPKEYDYIFKRIGEDIASGIDLKALMDVEAIYTKKGLRVLEIDARIPSQTPAAVWAATDVNLLEEMVFSALGKETSKVSRNECSAYEHYLIRDGNLMTCGEKEFGRIRDPRFDDRFFGADEAITDYDPNKNEWRATIMTKGKSPSDVLERRKQFIREVMDECGLDEYIDRSPRMI